MNTSIFEWKPLQEKPLGTRTCMYKIANGKKGLYEYKVDNKKSG